MPPGLDNLKHIVVVMMSSRSFDHMLGGLKAVDPRIDGLTGHESNLDTTGGPVKMQPLAQFQGQLDPDPDHHFPGVDLQIFGGDTSNSRVATMQGFVRSYFNQGRDVSRSHRVMYYFTPDKLPVLTTLATQFAVFNGWFSSVPGPAICNRAFAHYGTSFGQVSTDIFSPSGPYKSIYERMITAGPANSAKIYYYDEKSSTMDVTVNLLRTQPQLFATYDQFLADCENGTLPEYSFVDPNHNDHESEYGLVLASDQHPGHDVQAGEIFIASVYNAIRHNPTLWASTALLIVYDEHGGIYDHVPPPACIPDGFAAAPNDTATGRPFAFDRLGVRVPAILVSPWIPRGTVVSGRTFEHASIPATITKFFLGDYDPRSPREKSADTFLDLLSLPSMRIDAPIFETDPRTGRIAFSERTIAGYRSDTASGDDLLGVARDVEALCSVLAAKDVKPPISVGLFGDWGMGKTFFMRQMEAEFNRINVGARNATGGTAYCLKIVQMWFNAWHYIDANLWASLVSHIFEQLAAYISPQRDDQQSRALLLSELETAKELMAEAELQRGRALRQQQETEDELKKLAQKRAETEAKLSDLRLPDLKRLLQADPGLRARLETTLESLGFPAAIDTLAGLEKTIEDAYSLGGRLRTVFVSLWQSKNRNTQIALLITVLLGFPALTWVLKFYLPQQWLFTRVGTVWGEVSILALSLTTTLRKYLQRGSEYLTKIESDRHRITTLLEEKKQEKSSQQLELEKKLHEIKAKEAGASKQFSDAQEKVRAIGERIKEISEGRSPPKFILERVHADDYRKHLGIISSIRKDFERLNELLPRGGTQSAGDTREPIERIVLYIDDLDRCPEDKVVEVLQAIHLLLFFPLFVVVVGVDSRWLLHSLRQHSRVFQDTSRPSDGFPDFTERAHWQSTPLNYLEKIFQIPFAVQPMAVEGFERLVDSLSEPHATETVAVGGSSGTPGGSATIRHPEPASEPTASVRQDASPSIEVPSRIEQPAAPQADMGRAFDANPRHLQIEESERRFMHRLYPLIPSPRAAKRFINIYRLLRTSVGGDEISGFLNEVGGGEYKAVQLLLAIQTGYPEPAMQIIEDLLERSPQETWLNFIASYDGRIRRGEAGGRQRRPKTANLEGDTASATTERIAAERWRELLDRMEPLIEHNFAGRSCDDFIKWAPRVARYSFQSVRVLQFAVPEGEASGS